MSYDMRKKRKIIMNTYIDSILKNFDNGQNVEVYVNLITIENTLSIPSSKWSELLQGIREQSTGRVILSKAFKEKPAKLLRFLQTEDKNLQIEIYVSTDEKWNFQEEYFVSLEDIEAFAPIFLYSTNNLKNLKKEIADKVLADTTFLSREQQ